MYHKENVFLNWILVGLLIVSGAAFAQGVMGDGKDATPDFAKLDIDADGFVTAAEARQASGLSEMFGSVDSNSDGKLDAGEYAEYQAQVKSGASSSH